MPIGVFVYEQKLGTNFTHIVKGNVHLYDIWQWYLKITITLQELSSDSLSVKACWRDRTLGKLSWKITLPFSHTHQEYATTVTSYLNLVSRHLVAERNQEGIKIFLTMAASASRRTSSRLNHGQWVAVKDLKDREVCCAVCSPALHCDAISMCTVSYTVRLIPLPLPGGISLSTSWLSPLQPGKYTYPLGKRNYSSKYYKI